jgi:hypothetical protein
MNFLLSQAIFISFFLTATFVNNLLLPLVTAFFLGSDTLLSALISRHPMSIPLPLFQLVSPHSLKATGEIIVSYVSRQQRGRRGILK